MSDSIKKIKFQIRRFNPEKDSEPHWKSYFVNVRQGMTVLEGLHQIKENKDSTLSYRFSCRMGVCGSCAMLVNGKPMLTCNNQILDLTDSVLVVAPLPNFDIVKDLVPDLVPLFERHSSVKPYIMRSDLDETKKPTGELFQTPRQLVDYLQFSYCIKCGACLAACPTMATDKNFIGPQALAQAYRYISDTRDNGYEERKEAVSVPHGVFNCHYGSECSRVCPKGVDPAKAIQLLKRKFVFDYLKFWKNPKPAGFCKKPENVKRMNGVPEPPAYTVPQK